MTTANGQRVLVTAGAGGIGRSIATAFASAGARVHACDIDAQALNDLHAQVPGITTSVCDVADRGAVQRMVEEATDVLGAAGSIVVVMSSLAGRFGYPNRSPYATTKWGLIGFTKTLSRELGEFGIRVNAILPGAVDGPRLRQVFEGRASITGRSVAEEEAAALANQSIQRFVDPADIAALVVFLASGAARSISGQMIPIDGDSQSAS